MALEAQKVLTEKTNDLLKQNSQMLKTAAIETAREAERPIVDMDTLRKCNNDLIYSIKEVVKIHEQGAAQRGKAQDELIKIEEDLKRAMLEAASR